MKISELRNLTLDELQRRLDDSKEEQFNLRFQQASGQLEDTNRLRILRRNVARIHTIIRERQLEAEVEKEGKNG
jgi:large subunit ribosomal protein L29